MQNVSLALQHLCCWPVFVGIGGYRAAPLSSNQPLNCITEPTASLQQLPDCTSKNSVPKKTDVQESKSVPMFNWINSVEFSMLMVEKAHINSVRASLTGSGESDLSPEQPCFLFLLQSRWFLWEEFHVSPTCAHCAWPKHSSLWHSLYVTSVFASYVPCLVHRTLPTFPTWC